MGLFIVGGRTVTYICKFFVSFGMFWRVVTLAIIPHLLIFIYRPYLQCNMCYLTHWETRKKCRIKQGVGISRYFLQGYAYFGTRKVCQLKLDIEYSGVRFDRLHSIKLSHLSWVSSIAYANRLAQPPVPLTTTTGILWRR